MARLSAALPPGREFEFSPPDFERVRQLIHQRAGISLAASKQDMVYSRLAPRLRALGCERFSQYLAHLDNPSDGEWQAFVNALTTNLTYFFREAGHFQVLARHLGNLRHRPLRIWCAAAATGEEAYSLAMTACEAFDSLKPPVQILASDIDTRCIAAGAAGVYPADRARRLSSERLQRFFVTPSGGRPDQIQVRADLKRLVKFTPINLLAGHWPVRGPLDAIFCRNVMIYFDKPTQQAVLERFHPLLRAGGLLFAGHSENFVHQAGRFKSMGQKVYIAAD